MITTLLMRSYWRKMCTTHSSLIPWGVCTIGEKTHWALGIKQNFFATAEDKFSIEQQKYINSTMDSHGKAENSPVQYTMRTMYLLLTTSASQFSLSDHYTPYNEITLNLNTATKLAFGLKKLWQIFQEGFGKREESSVDWKDCCVLRIKE